MKKFILPVLALAMLMGCKTAEQALLEQGGTLVPVTEVKLLVLGNTLLTKGIDPRGRSFKADVFVSPDGNTHALSRSEGREVENRGKYTFDSDKLCFEWILEPRWGKGCANVYKKPDGEYAIYNKESGREISSFSILKGNPKGL